MPVKWPFCVYQQPTPEAILIVQCLLLLYGVTSVPLCCVLYLQGRLSEEDWAQLEEAASCAQVLKVKVYVKNDLESYSDSTYARASRALAAGFSRNSSLREVTLHFVPEELVESLRRTLCTNTALTVIVTRPTL